MIVHVLLEQKAHISNNLLWKLVQYKVIAFFCEIPNALMDIESTKRTISRSIVPYVLEYWRVNLAVLKAETFGQINHEILKTWHQ
jgi:hypothetical protein